MRCTDDGGHRNPRRPYESRALKRWVGDLLEPGDVYRVVSGCCRVYFGMSVSAGYLEAAVTMAAVAREAGVNALVNMAQMAVSEMSIQNTTPSHQQRQHWLSEPPVSSIHGPHGFPSSVVLALQPKLRIETIYDLDVGCNCGNFRRWKRSMWPCP